MLVECGVTAKDLSEINRRDIYELYVISILICCACAVPETLIVFYVIQRVVTRSGIVALWDCGTENG